MPESLSNIIYECLIKTPKKRPQNVDVIISAIEGYLQGDSKQIEQNRLENDKLAKAIDEIRMFIGGTLADGILDQDERIKIEGKALDLGLSKDKTEELIQQMLEETGAKEEFPVEIINCVKCGNELKPNWKKCPKCKTLAPIKVVKINKDILECPQCSTPLKSNWKKCPKCKSPILK